MKAFTSTQTMLGIAVIYAAIARATTTGNLADLDAERLDSGRHQIKRQAAQTLTPLPWNLMKSPFVRILSSVYGPYPADYAEQVKTMQTLTLGACADQPLESNFRITTTSVSTSVDSGKETQLCRTFILDKLPYGEDVFGLRAVGGDKNGLGLTYPTEQPEGKTQQLQIYWPYTRPDGTFPPHPQQVRIKCLGLSDDYQKYSGPELRGLRCQLQVSSFTDKSGWGKCLHRSTSSSTATVGLHYFVTLEDCGKDFKDEESSRGYWDIQEVPIETMTFV